ncbi:exosortase family protein XrtF [Formosa algae]|uniref:Exosortase family protein XrtF n=1 Tax=Formosa algae TaxID=225843 RepID=A0A9X1CAH6_9FLAO|nr:exosortase family protein XrtF [Formosa algae]MBP1838190.1 exosortase family protein XrtF [Formosa algae]MDQ0334325.1 exosortase family protein XrtF [Formosa algae]OEI80726.1 exosortase family protein XrtF [Formosa algae]
MKTLFKTYKPVIRFVITFLAVYFIMSLCYKWYLDVSKTTQFQPDYITYQVAEQSQAVLNVFGFKSTIQLQEGEQWVRLYLNDTYIIRVIEGCNAISVIILFMAFIMAFASTIEKTVLYVLAGTTLIYMVNVLRIALISIALYYYPESEHLIHGVIFPLIIYGMVFLLWVFWVNNVVKPKKKYAEHSTV